MEILSWWEQEEQRSYWFYIEKENTAEKVSIIQMKEKKKKEAAKNTTLLQMWHPFFDEGEVISFCPMQKQGKRLFEDQLYCLNHESKIRISM